MSNFTELAKSVLEANSTHHYYEGDPKRGGMSDDEALAALNAAHIEAVKGLASMQPAKEGEDRYYELSRILDKQTWEFAKAYWKNQLRTEIIEELSKGGTDGD